MNSYFLSTILNPDFFLFQSDASHHSILTFSFSTFTHTKQQLSHVTIAVQESDRRLPSVGIKSSRISLNLLLFSLPSTLRLTACSYSRPVSSQAACSMCAHSTLDGNGRGEMWEVSCQGVCSDVRIEIEMVGVRSNFWGERYLHGLVSAHPVMNQSSWCNNSQTQFYFNRFINNGSAPTIHNHFPDFADINCGILVP